MKIMSTLTLWKNAQYLLNYEIDKISKLKH